MVTTPAIIPPTTIPPTTPECTNGETREEECYTFYCSEERWEEFGLFHHTESCCRKISYPGCKELFPGR